MWIWKADSEVILRFLTAGRAVTPNPHTVLGSTVLSKREEGKPHV